MFHNFFLSNIVSFMR